ncbi:LOW QUALITY PROTEIN: sex peptide receptor-like [Pomacea canaliculata]|uniref:LOW QUALITY PROTEIN: sex peptide receptor-like n=1 Tax=Pomacea canaliculata TaxID=400727 RepID=UPI000D736C4B|nr:LOW QUALITY PROTEIN: sex peptide receptor-like [Pomacea canaliculata]
MAGLMAANVTAGNNGSMATGDKCPEESGPFSSINRHLEAYAMWYWGIHGYLSVVICVFGITTNVLNIVILTRGAMRTPINCILTAIAICCLITMSSYIPFALHFYIKSTLVPTSTKYSYGWTVYMAVHSNISVTTHVSSLWLAVFMAIMRYVYLQTKKCCNLQATCIISAMIGAGASLLMLPNYLMTGVREVQLENMTLYKLNEPAIGSTNPSRLALTAFWLYAIGGKLIPCTLISVFIGLLLKKLHESAARRKRLFASANKSKKSQCGRTTRHQCTTTMLLVIIVMYILTEVPQTFLIIMSAFSKQFFMNVYMLLADTMDMIALINNAMNFVLYCAMSQQFREHLVVRVCNGPPQSTRFGKKTYQSVDHSCNNTHTHGDGLCATTATTEKSISHV